MENFAITLVCIALLIIGSVSITMSALSAVNAVADALRTEEGLARDMASTSILCRNTNTVPGGATATMYVFNDGKTSLANFAAWDVIVRYQNGNTAWIPYSAATPGWQTGGFFFPGPSGDLPTEYS
jgi:hypothetical protein